MMSASWAPMMAAMMLPGALPAIAAERRSGLRFGAWCMGSSVGLMAVLVALDPMNLPLMCAAGAIALIQKELLV